MTLLGPLFWYELQRLARRRQMHLWRVLYAGAMLLGLVVVYLRSFSKLPPLEALTNPGALDRSGNAAFAETFLIVFLAVQQLAVIVLTPLYAAGSIADEKERRTLDFLLSSPLPHYQILLGKLLSRLLFVGSIIAVGWPVLMLTFLFGGVDFEHLLAGFAVAAITAIFLGSLGVLLACLKNNLRETLPGIVMSLVTPALLGMCGRCFLPISALSPVTVLWFLFETWLANDPVTDETWSLVGYFAVLYLPLSLLLFFTAKSGLGDLSSTYTADERELMRKGVDAALWLNAVEPLSLDEPFGARVRRTYDVRPLRFDEDPLVWKEKSFHLPLFSPERGCFVMGCMSAVAGVVFIALSALFVILANNFAKGEPIGGVIRSLAYFVFVPAVTLGQAFLGARASLSLGRERSAQTLLTLLTLPIERTDILWAIAKAILHRDRGWLWFVGGTLAFVTFTCGVNPISAVAAFVLMVGCGAWALAFGIWLSVQVESPTRASLIFLSVWGAILLLPWFVAPFASSGYRDMIELACPPHGMIEVLSIGYRNREINWTSVPVTLGTGVVMVLLAGMFATHAAYTFEKEGR